MHLILNSSTGTLVTVAITTVPEMDIPIEEWLLKALNRILMVKDTAPSYCVMRKCGLEPLQFNWFQAAVQLYDTFCQSNSSTGERFYNVRHFQAQLRFIKCG